MNPLCARCGKIVYPTEKVNCLDKYWHKSCFHCEICRMTLNMKTYKGYEKKPYCNAHYPKQSFTIVADTPENIRLKQQSELQSQVKYKENFEKSRKLGFSIVTDTPEMQRLKRTQEQISNAFGKPIVEDRGIEFAKKCSDQISDIKYKEEHVKSKGKFTFVPDTPQQQCMNNATALISEIKYKGAGKEGSSKCLYAQMPATIDTVFAKEVSRIQSQKYYKHKHDVEKGKSSYSSMQEPPEVKHAMEVNRHQSAVLYKKEALNVHRYTEIADRLDIRKATQTSRLVSNIEYKNDAKAAAAKKTSIIGRPDIEHAKEVSKLTSQFNYKDKHIKEGKRHHYNPQESASFQQLQTANALASNVKYKLDLQRINRTASHLPNLLHLEHVLAASKLQSAYEYKKQFEKSKGHYHLALDTSEQLHYKENKILQSQVKYKEEYEKSKGKSMLEVMETPSYLATKEAQHLQSEKEYRKDYDEGIKGRMLVDLDMTPSYLHAKHVTSLLNEKEYRKEWAENIKGKGLTLAEDTPDRVRVRNASQILNEREYRKDLETQIKGKGMELSADVLDIKRALKASEIASQAMYKQVSDLGQNNYGTVTDTPELMHAAHLKDIYSQKKYKGEAEKMLSTVTTLADTPEMERVKKNQKNISTVRPVHCKCTGPETVIAVNETPEIRLAKENCMKFSDVKYKEEVGQGTAIPDPFDLKRIKENQKNISSVKYKEEVGQGTAIPDPFDLKRVKENQKNISSVKYKEEVGQGTAIPDPFDLKRVKENQKNISSVKYKEEVGQGTAIPDPFDLKRVKENQKNISSIKYKELVGKGTPVSVTIEMERAKTNQANVSLIQYRNDLKEMKGRPVLLLDTPEMKRVRETQNNISMIKYHEDFEKTKGRGFNPGLDDPAIDQARKNTQYVSDAAYKGVHPHVVEMEKGRPGVVGEFKVWRTDPGSIFDFDPLEDNIQSRSLHLLSEKVKRYSKQSESTSVGSVSVGDEKSEITELNHSFSGYSESTLDLSADGAAVLPGAYQQVQSPHSSGFGYMHQSSVSSMRPQHSQPVSLRTFRAMYDYTAADDDEVSFKDGDFIVNVQAIDEGWMYGTVQRTGSTGMLPANYVEPFH